MKSIDISDEDKNNFLLTQQQKIIDDYIYMTTSDLDGKIVEISTAYLNFTGYKRKDVIGKNHSIFRNHDIDKDVIKQLWETIQRDEVWQGELKNNKVTGEEYWIKTSISPLYDIHNVKIGYTAIKTDITDQVRLKELSLQDPLTLLHNRRYFDNYFKRELARSNFKHENLALLLLGIDYYEKYKDNHGRIESDKVILKIADSLQESLSSKTYEIFKVTELEFAIILLNYDDDYIENLSNKLLSSVELLKLDNSESEISQYFTISIGAVNINTQYQNFFCNDIYNLADANLAQAKKSGRNRAVMGINNQQVDNLINLDVITKLPNRGSLVYDISILEEDAMLVILHIKQISALKNLYGFDFASEVIVNKAQQLQNIIRDEEASLYSLNLQEFAILITNKNLFEKYFLLLKHSILVNNDYFTDNLDQPVTANFTAGIAYGTLNLFNHADLILQDAILSKLNYKVYHNNQSELQLQEENFKRLRIYKNALHQGNILPYFQPIVDALTLQVIKYEALARLETDDGEIISPYYFLDSAKEDKSFEYFTRQMMQKVFNVFAKNSVNISINITYENIVSDTMLDYIKNRLNTYGGEGITFEIVESEDIIDYKVVEEFVLMIKRYGCKVSIDDFGSGYSNFTNLLRLNLDYLKLDGSLIEKLNSDANVQSMIKGLVMYAKQANIKTIAEFVSSKELADSVIELGIDYLQGYYYGEPKAPEGYGLK